MKVALAGSRAFGAAVFELLDRAAAVELAMVAAPVGDGLAAAASRAGVEVVERIPPAHGCDLIVAAHSHQIVSKLAIQDATIGAIGYHPSLLPRHRGRDAVRWTIKMRDPIAGGSVYWLDGNVDGGPIAAQDWCHVDPSWSASDLWRHELFPMGVRLLRRVLVDVLDRRLVQVPQDEAVATWEPSWERPPLHRPDLPQIGEPAGWHVITRRGDG